ncbi:LysR substrate-binding domain-containing protein [Pseudonocardia acaciae]|uniref:LysR substrate-binding domain-containing protein n=1 Tax=Pseudonocardia acaciae TaxID=551276 RepID=UPI000688E785|nr:LysR substrate-binding domain-containing protein [Pseudonocardia acaciae]
MHLPDLNLLPALDALLREQSVTGAARRLSVSAPAMSRTLARLRRVTGDRLLVPAGRGLIPTPAALAMRPRVEAALTSALAVLQPPGDADPASWSGTVTIRTNDFLTAVLAPVLVERTSREAPGLTIRFLAEGDEDPADLRTEVDLDIGVLGPQPPDIHTEHLMTERLVGVVRAGHPLASAAPLELADFAATPQLTVSRRARAHGPVDDLLAERGLSRQVVLTVPSHSVAMSAALAGDLLALVPSSLAAAWSRVSDVRVVRVPLPLPPLRVALAWHARLDTDPAQAWVRAAVRAAAPTTDRSVANMSG